MTTKRRAAGSRRTSRNGWRSRRCGGDRTVQVIVAKHEVHPNQVGTWKRQAIEGLDEVFARGGSPGPSEHEATIGHVSIPAGRTFPTTSLPTGLQIDRTVAHPDAWRDDRLVLDLAECPDERLLVLGNHSALMTQRPRDHLPPRGWLPR